MFRSKIDPRDTVGLCRIPLGAKIEAVLKIMGPIEAPGLDGLSPPFFRSCWSTIKDEIVDLIQYFFICDTFKEGVNDTKLVLIRKECHTPADFRPIALCNVTYKVVAKIIANRIRPLLDDIISPH